MSMFPPRLNAFRSSGLHAPRPPLGHYFLTVPLSSNDTRADQLTLPSQIPQTAA
jgi:hypothetical protein